MSPWTTRNIFLICLFVSGGHGFHEDTPWHNELFGDGEFYEKGNKDGQHLSSSTSDLLKLFETEKALLKLLKETNIERNSSQTNDPNVKKYLLAKKQYLNEVDFSENQDTDEYVGHPVNAFHMMMRAARFYPTVKANPEPELNISLPLMPSLSDAKGGAVHGLTDIQEYYALNVSDLIRGRIVDRLSGKVYQAGQNLTSGEVLLIAAEAKRTNYLDAHVQWLRGALEAARAEQKPNSLISKIKMLIKQAMREHDDAYINISIRDYIIRHVRLKARPYIETLAMQDSIANGMLNKIFYTVSQSYFNLFEHEEIKKYPFVAMQVYQFLRYRIQHLCNGIFTRPSILDKDLRCVYLHHNNPFLRLGPFKYERMNKEPEVGVFHQLISEKQADKVIAKAKIGLRSTPYAIGQANVAYSKLRTSKVRYLNERLIPEAMEMSHNIQNATRFRLYTNPHASENYQVMNYGIGGTISGHYDSESLKFEEYGTSEELEFGGLRFVTFMLYLTDVELGGRTIFPQIGLSVKPEKGSALYWFNGRPKYQMDSRVNHLGCPVLVGNKWIANKWVKWISQYEEFPCSENIQHFSVEH